LGRAGGGKEKREKFGSHETEKRKNIAAVAVREKKGAGRESKLRERDDPTAVWGIRRTVGEALPSPEKEESRQGGESSYQLGRLGPGREGGAQCISLDKNHNTKELSIPCHWRESDHETREGTYVRPRQEGTAGAPCIP